MSSTAPRLAPQQIEVVAHCGPFLSPVLKRIVGMLAAQEELGVDRIEGSLAVMESLSQAACESIQGETLAIKIAIGEGTIAIDVGPLSTGIGELLQARVSEREPVALALMDELKLERSSDRERLAFRVSA